MFKSFFGWLGGLRWEFYVWGLMTLVFFGLYQHNLYIGSQRDAARAEVAALSQQLSTERAVSEGLAQVAKDAANQASAQASATLVQKNREITARNTELKKEIKNVYANTAPTLAQGDAVSTVPTHAFGSAGSSGTVDTCFGAEFDRLWNAANTLRGSETAAP